MDRNRERVLAGCVITSIVLFDAFVLLYVVPNLAFWIFYLPPVFAVGLLGVLFLPKFAAGDLASPPRGLASDFARRLRLHGYRVEEGPKHLAVRLGWLPSVKVSVQPWEGGSRVLYQLDATTSGWATIMFLCILIEFSFVPPLLILYVLLRVQKFVESELRPLCAEGALQGEVPAQEDVHAILVDSLSEAHRLASEASEFERSSHQDAQAVVALAALLTFAALLIVLYFGLPSMGLPSAGDYAFLDAAVLAAAVGVPAAWIVHRRYAPRIRDFSGWSERLERALRMEIAGEPAPGGAPSTFELVSEASRHVPTWIEARRRSGLTGDPGAGLLLGGMAIWIFTLFSAAFSAIGMGWPVAVAFFAVGVTLTVVLALAYVRWKRNWEATARRSLEDWGRRLARAQAAMERFLDGL